MMSSAWTQDALDAVGWWPPWELFGDAIATGCLLAIVLPWLGVLLFLRRQVFVAAAIGQAANVGIAAAMMLGVVVAGEHAHTALHLGGGWLTTIAALAAAIFAAFLAVRSGPGGHGAEARSAFVFLVGSASSLLLLSHAPHGLQALQRLFLSSLLAVSTVDVWFAATAVLLVGSWLVWQPRTLLHWASDPECAAVHGVAVRRFDVVAAIALGGVLGHAILAAGLLFTFGATVLPVMAARQLADSLRSVVMLAPMVGAAGVLGAFALAHRCDLPPAQVAVALYGAFVVVAHSLGRHRDGGRAERI
jgi:ABC-type Mn2+/Zn2+ transport system permease subunit